VEVLDAFFGNVCELDLVFNFYKVGTRETSVGTLIDAVLNLFVCRSMLY